MTIKKIFIAYLVIMTLLSTITAMASGHPKMDCKKVGISKVKPFKFKKSQIKKSQEPVKYSATPKFKSNIIFYSLK